MTTNNFIPGLPWDVWTIVAEMFEELRDWSSFSLVCSNFRAIAEQPSVVCKMAGRHIRFKEKVQRFITAFHLRHRGVDSIRGEWVPWPCPSSSGDCLWTFCRKTREKGLQFDEIQFEANLNDNVTAPSLLGPPTVFWDTSSSGADHARRPVKSIYVRCACPYSSIASGALVKELLRLWQQKVFHPDSHELQLGQPSLLFSHIVCPFSGRISIFCFYTWKCADFEAFRKTIPKTR